MSLLIAGTLCLDTIETPTGRVDRVLGGSGAYAAAAAALLTHVRLVSVVGGDFPAEHCHFLANRGVDLTGVEQILDARSQFWHGRYHPGLNTREHVAVDMDIFDRWKPKVPSEFRDSKHVFLAHMPPHLQLAVLDQLRNPEFVLVDTIDHWINTQRADVLSVIRRANAVVVNEQEAQLLTGQTDIQQAAKAIQRLGPQYAVIKQGGSGSYIDRNGEFFAVFAYPPEQVMDTTGAGDSFAGAMMGHLSATPIPTLHKLFSSAIIGSVAASFTVEGFGLAGLQGASRALLDERVARYRERIAELASPK